MSPPTFNCSAVPAEQRAACDFVVAYVVPAAQADYAAVEDAFAQVYANVDSFFLIWGGALVVSMHIGFAMLSAGAIRSKNVKNMLLCITLDLCFCALAWFLTGFGFAFGVDNGNGFIGTTNYVGLQVGGTGSVSFSLWFFEFAFAATAATIVSGAVAERARFETYCGYSFFISGFVYPIVAHWVWGGGYLTLGKTTSVLQIGALDFAGSGVVHTVAGLAGAIACKVIGPRIGRFDPETGKPLPIAGHSSALVNLGTFLLWIGWFGFNSASGLTLKGTGGDIAGRAAVNTILSSGAATISALFWAYIVRPHRVFDFGVAMNGALAGLVSITAPCAGVEMWAAIVIGLTGGLVYVGTSDLVLKLGLDDPLDATAVHYFCGMWGLLCSGIFANPVLIGQLTGNPAETRGGFLYPGATGALLACQLVEICVINVWVAGLLTPLFLALHYVGVLRVQSEIEEEGLDSSHHGGAAYPELFHAGEFSEGRKSAALLKQQGGGAEAAPAAGAAPEPAPAAAAPAQQPEAVVTA